MEKLSEALWQIYRRPERPSPWRIHDGNLPWDDPAFSERMLREHLDESHGAATRQTAERQRIVGEIGRNKFSQGTATRDYAREKDVVDKGREQAAALNDPALTSRGTTHVYEGEHLTAINFMVGGIGAGAIQFNGKAEPAIWQVACNHTEHRVADSFLALRRGFTSFLGSEAAP